MDKRKNNSTNFNYVYVDDDGIELRRDDVFSRIKKFLQTINQGSVEEIRVAVKLPRDSVYGLLNQLVIRGDIIRIRSGRKRKYQIADRCLLADMLYPVEEITKCFKVKGVIKRTQEQGKNFTSLSNGHVSHYAHSNYDIVYDSGE